MTAISVGDCRWLDFPRIEDERGHLTFVEAGHHVPFAIRRVYYLYDVPRGARRGGHAHRQLEQVLVAASGHFDVMLDDGVDRRRVRLDRANRGLYVPRMIWRELEGFSDHAVCLVLASEFYDEGDYYRDHDTFLYAARPGGGSVS